MALIQAEVDIANQSLARIGANRFTLATAANEEGVVATLMFDQTRDALLRGYWWPFPSVRLRLVSAWLTATVYTTDQYVWQAALLYKCATAHTSGTFATDLAAAKWVLVSSVSDWATATAYVLGETVVNNAILYECIKAHTSGDTDDEPGVGATTATYWVVTITKPTNTFGYSYNTPSAMIRLLQFLYLDGYIGNIRGTRTWRIESNTILTNETEVDILYTTQQTDTTKWDPLFTEMFIVQLAINMTGPLSGVGSGGLQLKEMLLKELQILRKQVRTIARQEGRGDNYRVSWNKSRHTNGGRIDSQMGS